MERRTAHSMQNHSEGPPESLRLPTDLFLPRRRRTELPDRKTERHAYLRRSEVVLMPPTEVTSAFLPNVAVVIRTKIAQSCRSLDAPIFSEGPSVPVCHTRPIQGPLVSPVAHAQKLHASDIEIGIQKMHAQKMPFETVAEPMPDFGLYHPEFEFPIVAECPGIISRIDLERNPRSQPHLKTCIEGRGSPIKRIRLDFQQGKSRLRFGRWFLGSGPASLYDSQTQRNTEYIPLHPFVFYLPVYIRRTAAAAVDTHSCSHTCSTIQAHKLAVNRSKSDVTDPFALA